MIGDPLSAMASASGYFGVISLLVLVLAALVGASLRKGGE